MLYLLHIQAYYLKYNNKYVSIQDDDILTINATMAEELVKNKIINKVKGEKSRSDVLVEVGEFDGGPITVRNGRYGPYINWNKINVKLPSAYSDNPASLPLDEAQALIEAKLESGSVSGDSARKSTSKSSSTNLPPPPKRPLSSYMHFCSAMRPGLANSGKSLGEISKELAQRWSETPEDSRKPYEEMASVSKQEYEEKKKEWEEKCNELSAKNGVSKSTKSKTKAASTKSGDLVVTIKRPKSSYLFFCEEKRPEVAQQFKTMGEITKELGRLWSETSDREKYEKLAAEAKNRYNEEKTLVTTK